MQSKNLVKKAHELLGVALRAGDIVVDASMGNGHDTAFLANKVGNSGHVYAFDIQDVALHNTQKKIHSLGIDKQVTLIKDCHSNILKNIPAIHLGKIRAIMFNLGYLPRSDKSIITKEESTLSALEQSLQLISKDGVISILIYYGHVGGREEGTAIKTWLQQKNISHVIFSSESANDETPELIIISNLETKDIRS